MERGWGRARGTLAQHRGARAHAAHVGVHVLLGLARRARAREPPETSSGGRGGERCDRETSSVVGKTRRLDIERPSARCRCCSVPGAAGQAQCEATQRRRGPPPREGVADRVYQSWRRAMVTCSTGERREDDKDENANGGGDRGCGAVHFGTVMRCGDGALAARATAPNAGRTFTRYVNECLTPRVRRGAPRLRLFPDAKEPTESFAINAGGPTRPAMRVGGGTSVAAGGRCRRRNTRRTRVLFAFLTRGTASRSTRSWCPGRRSGATVGESKKMTNTVSGARPGA